MNWNDGGEAWRDSWNDGSADTEGPSEPEDEGALHKVGRWLNGMLGKKEEAGNDTPDEEAEIESARQRVQEYYASGQADEHNRRRVDPAYRATSEYTIATETEHLERHLIHYDDACSRFGSDALLSQELWAKRIAVLNRALADAERTANETQESYVTLEERWQRGELSQAEYDDMHRKLGRKEQRANTRLGMGGLGGSFEDIGDIADQAGHILVDGLSDDRGEIRQKIAKKLRGMPRRTAMEILQQAVADGKISQVTADYLIRECVRPS